MIIPKRERILLPPERKRDKQLKIWVSQEELDLIHQKMEDFGTHRMGAFVRKLVIDGYVIKLEIPDLKEIIRLLGPIGNNVNQIARKLNAGGSIYREDIAEVNNKLDAIYTQLEFEAWVHEAQVTLRRYNQLLYEWKFLAPKDPGEDFYFLFVEALQNSARVKYLLCTLAFGTEEEKREIYLNCREGVKQIYERIQIFDALSGETDAEAE